MKSLIIVIVCLSAFATSTNTRQRNEDTQRRVHPWRLTAIANKFFAHRLFSIISRTTPQAQNFFISPYAVSAGLSMTLYGAQGQTAEEIMQVLGYTELLIANEYGQDRVPRLYEKMQRQLMKPGLGFTLVSANRMFGDQSQTFVPAFVNGVRQYYGAGLMEVNFLRHPQEARTIINEWVAGKTNNTIREAMSPNSITSNTVLALVSTLYFKGQWETPFTKTIRETFTTSEGERYETDFMSGRFNINYAEADKLDSTWIELTYATSSRKYQITMELLKPNTNTNTSLLALERQLTEDALDFATRYKTPRRVDILLPKIRLEYGRDLSEVLNRMGINDLFNPAAADLSGINNDFNLSLGSAEHKTFLEVNEQGTVAGASFGQSQTRNAVQQIEFNHPFIIIIRERHTQMPLFMGRIAEPGR